MAGTLPGGGTSAPGVNGGGFGGLLSGISEGAGISAFDETIVPSSPQASRPIQNSQGGATVDNSINFQGDVGMNPMDVTTAMDQETIGTVPDGR